MWFQCQNFSCSILKIKILYSENSCMKIIRFAKDIVLGVAHYNKFDCLIFKSVNVLVLLYWVKFQNSSKACWLCFTVNRECNSEEKAAATILWQSHLDMQQQLVWRWTAQHQQPQHRPVRLVVLPCSLFPIYLYILWYFFHLLKTSLLRNKIFGSHR